MSTQQHSYSPQEALRSNPEASPDVPRTRLHYVQESIGNLQRSIEARFGAYNPPVAEAEHHVRAAAGVDQQGPSLENEAETHAREAAIERAQQSAAEHADTHQDVSAFNEHQTLSDTDAHIAHVHSEIQHYRKARGLDVI